MVSTDVFAVLRRLIHARNNNLDLWLHPMESSLLVDRFLSQDLRSNANQYGGVHEIPPTTQFDSDPHQLIPFDSTGWTYQRIAPVLTTSASQYLNPVLPTYVAQDGEGFHTQRAESSVRNASRFQIEDMSLLNSPVLSPSLSSTSGGPQYSPSSSSVLNSAPHPIPTTPVSSAAIGCMEAAYLSAFPTTEGGERVGDMEPSAQDVATPGHPRNHKRRANNGTNPSSQAESDLTPSTSDKRQKTTARWNPYPRKRPAKKPKHVEQPPEETIPATPMEFIVISVEAARQRWKQEELKKELKKERAQM